MQNQVAPSQTTRFKRSPSTRERPGSSSGPFSFYKLTPCLLRCSIRTPITARERKTMQTHTSGRAAFTLVEIMIVVAIIGLLAAIAIPNFVRARENAQRTACTANLKGIDGIKGTWAL